MEEKSPTDVQTRYSHTAADDIIIIVAHHDGSRESYNIVIRRTECRRPRRDFGRRSSGARSGKRAPPPSQKVTAIRAQSSRPSSGGFGFLFITQVYQYRLSPRRFLPINKTKIFRFRYVVRTYLAGIIYKYYM